MTTAKASELAHFVSGNPVRRGAILAFVERFAAGVPEGARVLDVGAGLAPYRGHFAHAVYQTHDWPNSVHDRAPDIVGDVAVGLDVPAGSFDAILCTEVLEHVLTPADALGELRRLLRPGGQLGLTVPFVVALHEEPWDYWRPTRYALAATLEAAGFGEVEIMPLSGWFGTLAEILIDFGLSTRDVSRPGQLRRLIGKAVKLVGLGIGRLAPTLDRHDQRKAFPVGWSVTATAAK